MPGAFAEPQFVRPSWWRRWFGRRSERIAEAWLRKHGFHILGRNIVERVGEIDLLALDGETIVIVEVRSTERADPAPLSSTINQTKQRRLAQAALRFLQRRKLLDVNVRFDVLLIGFPADAREPTILHHRHAFESSERFQFFT